MIYHGTPSVHAEQARLPHFVNARHSTAALSAFLDFYDERA
jgi:hypothetical protein